METLEQAMARQEQQKKALKVKAMPKCLRDVKPVKKVVSKTAPKPLSPTEQYKALWSAKTTKQVQKELLSWRKHMQKHASAYQWHGANLTAPGEMSDGQRVLMLKEILQERGGDI